MAETTVVHCGSPMVPYSETQDSSDFCVMDLPEAILMNILKRLPLRSIARFKSVCKEWKSLMESSFFREQFLSTNTNSSSSAWSLLRREQREAESVEEVVGLYECRRWGLSQSLGQYIPYLETDPNIKVNKIIVIGFTQGLVLLRVRSEKNYMFYVVGNPVLRQWVRVDGPEGLSSIDVEFPNFAALVTNMEDGVVVGYKIVMKERHGEIGARTSMSFLIYSSHTGAWDYKRVKCPRPLYLWTKLDPIDLNGNLHWLEIAYLEDVVPGAVIETHETRGIVALDFYDDPENYQYRVIPFPDLVDDDHLHQRPRSKRVCTTSAGSLVYISRAFENGDSVMRVWRLNRYTSDSGEWHLSWQINTERIGFGVRYTPLAMHPHNAHLLYVWSFEESCIVSCDMRMDEFKLLKESQVGDDNDQEGIQIVKDCRQHVESYNLKRSYDDTQYISQFVLPRWLAPIPRPPSSG